MTDQQRLVDNLRHACTLGAVEAIHCSQKTGMDTLDDMHLMGRIVFGHVLEALAKEYGLPMPEKEEAVA